MFNFEAVHSQYQKITSNYGVQTNVGEAMSKSTFLKVFLDLVERGFIKCENETDILNVNNKLALGFSATDIERILMCNEVKDLPRNIATWATQS